MDIGQRQKWIIDQVNKLETIKISDISKKLNISRETIRKDIYTLDQQGIVRAIRGGATLPNRVKETKYGKRKEEFITEKQEIARNAIRFIHNGDSVFLDYGSSAVQVAEAIKKSNLRELTVITSSTNVLKCLEFYNNNIQIIFLGGSFRQSEGSVSGPLTLNNISSIYCDVGFFGCGGVDLNAGITNHYFGEVEVSKKMMEHCKVKIVLADHSKFKKNALYKTSDISNVDVIISDCHIDDDIANRIRLADTTVISGDKH
ncbi:DeoR/GlpR family DNA-binding transcription regulator [Loigolactobacillus bifermentans]|uniref:HTH deoR-type domain-containing protein n=1 Tax=Loigolactobacillus bifermentans DSM 20003 TaxID=1423726 RepID=A0A0R1GLK4_9LACO|nr:DeoR/GlpR family DNA-binding transcription regulator [Loigolactobacillus bifermentans]KRK33315.1 hypothetical protein FC07_GL001239 [Loigolactobacillus bifermentans DSM 20003]QGG60839.1 DeoR family transcriptional regulator [Loigolactobacillus bifermentans]